MRKSRKQQIAAPVSAHASLSSCILAQNGGLLLLSVVACLIFFTSYFPRFDPVWRTTSALGHALTHVVVVAVEISSHPIDTKNKQS